MRLESGTKTDAIRTIEQRAALEAEQKKGFNAFFKESVVHETGFGGDLRHGAMVSSPSGQIYLGPRDWKSGLIPITYFDFNGLPPAQINGHRYLNNDAPISLVSRGIELLPEDVSKYSTYSLVGNKLYVASGNRIYTVGLDSLKGASNDDKIEAQHILDVPGKVTSLHPREDGSVVWGGLVEDSESPRRKAVVGIDERIVASGASAFDSAIVGVTTDKYGNIIANGLNGNGVTRLDNHLQQVPIIDQTKGVYRVISCGEGDDRIVMLQGEQNPYLEFINPDGTTTAPLYIPFSVTTALNLGNGLTLLGGRNDSVGVLKGGRLAGARSLSHMSYTKGGIGGLTSTEDGVFALSTFTSKAYELPKNLNNPAWGNNMIH